ncbi:MAG: hypothetical protein ABR542_02170 [Desulfonatronovibrio sp.]
MSREEKKGLFSRLFGLEKSGCCNTRIEEIPENDNGQGDKDQPQNKNLKKDLKEEDS